MANLSTNILILFAISSTIVFALTFLRDGALKRISWTGLPTHAVPFLLSMVPWGLGLALAHYLGDTQAEMLPYFGGAAVLSFLLYGLNLPPSLRGVLLLVASVAVSLHWTADTVVAPACGVLLGLAAAKLTENLLLSDQSTLEDILPAFIWLTGLFWIGTASAAGDRPAQAGLLLGIISIAQLTRIIPGKVVPARYIDEDNWFLTRIVLSATAGLCVLLVITKMLTAVHYETMSWLVGGAMFATFLFHRIEEKESDALGFASMKVLIVAGMLTLVATRLFGTLGLLMMAPAALIAPVPGFAQLLGAYFGLRVLLQVFLNLCVVNVTDINITHPYSSAALYAGLLLMILAAMFVKSIANKKVLLSLFVGAGLIVPIASNYLLHAEPTGALLDAAVIGAILLAAMGPALQKDNTRAYENLMLLPVTMITAALAANGLIETGNETTSTDKLHMIAYTAGGVIAIALALWLGSRTKNLKPPLQTSE